MKEYTTSYPTVSEIINSEYSELILDSLDMTVSELTDIDSQFRHVMRIPITRGDLTNIDDESLCLRIIDSLFEKQLSPRTLVANFSVGDTHEIYFETIAQCEYRANNRQ